MSDPTDDPDRDFEETPILKAIKDDVTATLGWYFPPVRRVFGGGILGPVDDPPPDGDAEFTFARFDDELGGYRRVASFGDDGWLTANAGGGREFTIARWELIGSHYRPIQAMVGDATTVEATGNPVHIDGLTIVEAKPDGKYTIRRFVDWLPLYAQLGVVFHGRPVGLAQTVLRDAIPDGPRRR